MSVLDSLIFPGAPILDDTPVRPALTISKISDRLYLGNLEDAISAETLRAYNIIAVLSVMQRRPEIPLVSGVPSERQPSLNNMHVRLEDKSHEDMLRHLADICAFIDLSLADTASDPNPGAVLVHCRMGVSRSAAMVVAYLMQKNNWDTETAVREVKTKRLTANPEGQFGAQLRMWHDMKFDIWDGFGACGKGVPKSQYCIFLGTDKCCTNPSCKLASDESTKQRSLEWWEEVVDDESLQVDEDDLLEDEDSDDEEFEEVMEVEDPDELDDMAFSFDVVNAGKESVPEDQDSADEFDELDHMSSGFDVEDHVDLAASEVTYGSDDDACEACKHC